MICTFKILADNLIQNATITASRSEVSTDYSVDNLKNENRAHTARWAAGANVVLDIVLSEKAALNYLSLLGLDLDLDGKVTIQGFYNDDFTDSRLNESDLDIGGYIPIGIFTPGVHYYGEKAEEYGDDKVSYSGENVLVESIRITIQSTEEINIRMLVLGYAESFTMFSQGHQHSVRGDQTANTSVRGYKMHGNKRSDARSISVNPDFMTDEDQMKLHRLEKTFGDNSWLFIGRDWDTSAISAQFEMLCFPEKITFTGTSRNIWAAPLVLKEA